VSVASSYARYYRSGLYDARYPAPNPGTYRRILERAVDARRVLDFGAGSGRYALPLLRDTAAFVCAHDLAEDACRTLEERAAAAGVDADRRLVTTDPGTMAEAGPYDLVIALFGVLSHIEGAARRVRTLRRLRDLLATGGTLLLTVPNARRRFPLHVSRAPGPLPLRYAPFARPIVYRHELDGGTQHFPYFLYTPRRLAAELRAAGLHVETLETDSVLPERDLARRPALGRIDAVLCRTVPTELAYGLRAVCQAA